MQYEVSGSEAEFTDIQGQDEVLHVKPDTTKSGDEGSEAALNGA